MDGSTESDLKKVLKASRSSFVIAGFFSFFINFLMLVPAIYMLQVYDRVITSGSHSTLTMLTLIMVFLMISMALLDWSRGQMLVRVSSKIETLLNERLFKATFKGALLSGGSRASAQSLDDLTGLRQFLTGNGLFSFFDAPWLPIYIAVMFVFHPLYGWVAVATAMILLVLAVLNEKVTSKDIQEANNHLIKNRALVNKNLRNAEAVSSMGMLPGIMDKWLKSANAILALQSRASSKAVTISSISKSIRQISQSLILGLGAYLVLQHEITPGLMIAGSILLGRALAPIDTMINSWKGFVAARGQYERLSDLLTKVPDDKERMSLPEPKGKLILDGVVVAPLGSKTPVINGVSFALEVGDSLGIIGPSAAGKSTLARAILGIYPTLSGDVRLDGVNVFDWNREEVGPYIGYLPQDIELFDGTISENIARFGEIDAEKVIEAARLADVHEMILKLPDGYDTFIGSVGGVLSGGQRQRIGLARAVYGAPKLVLLDEPNSNLDDQGEYALAKAIQTLKNNKTTVIVITHRTGILTQLDKLLVLKDGKTIAFNSRDEVLKQLQNSAQQVRKQ
jgi:ATP-binding cassette subfamily C protein EexD